MATDKPGTSEIIFSVRAPYIAPARERLSVRQTEGGVAPLVFEDFQVYNNSGSTPP